MKKHNGGRKPGAGRPPSSSYRTHERRDCSHYYGEEGCLHQAARRDLRAVPCKGCGLYSHEFFAEIIH